jgi:hypothetical protein
MQKPMKIVLGVAAAALVAVVAARMIYASQIKSEGFRKLVEATATNAASAWMPGAKISIGELRVAGLAAIEAHRVVVSGDGRSLTAKRVRIDPGYLAAVFSSDVPFSVEAAIAPGAALSLVGKVPKSVISGESASGWTVKGRVSKLDAVTVLGMAFATKPNRAIAMSGGQFNGDFTYDDAKRLGTFKGTLNNPEWTLKMFSNRKIKAEDAPLSLRVKAGEVSFTDPVALKSALGRVEVGGSFSWDDRGLRWDLTVDPQNNPILRQAVGFAFRCGGVPGSGKFVVNGPAKEPNCRT